jgi:raffinose/stachyose/melibiose transport system permease protein
MTETALHRHPPRKGKLALPRNDVVPASLTAPFTGLPRFLILCFVGTLVIVPLLATAILPLFIKVRDLGLHDTHWGIILPQVAFSQALSILLMRNAFRQLPSELLDAALVDGCGYIRFFVSITLPLSRPILATVAVISFVMSWNNFLLPLVVINTNAKYPWTLGLMDYQGEFIVAWQLILAFITLTILPAMLMFMLAQKHIVSGLTAGAVKG